jgi:type I restriction-modification system DNA methylase subunit
MYSFDAIPLEFVSSIYEEFVSQQQHQKKSNDTKKHDPKREKGVYYTKSHLVDFILDNILPWDDKNWNLKILDPSCGSGIFLVKAFQRLVYRWENSLPQKTKKALTFSKQKKEKIIDLLENNLFGVDIDKHAVRVASFSLYLALCDELDPKTLWQEVTFPNLREKQVVARDFFDEDEPLFRQHKEEIKYDLIIGNAPWGRDTINTSQRAKSWAKNTGWETSYGNIGPLFLPKAASLAKENAYISLVQPALPILTGQSGKSERFRKKLFTDYKVDEIVNLSDLRFVLFEKAVSPPCIITMRPNKPDGSPIQYICPKKRGTDEDYRQIVIEPMDVNFVQLKEAIDEPWIWSSLMWGNRRDSTLIYRLQTMNTVAKVEHQKKALTRQGIKRGNRKNKDESLLNMPILEKPDFPADTFLTLNNDLLPNNKDIFFDGQTSTNFDSFASPQVFIKQTWKAKIGRFVGSFINSKTGAGTISSSSYLNIYSQDCDFLKSLVVISNSKFATYYLLLTDGRFAFYRPDPSVDSFWQIPIPDIKPKVLEKLEKMKKDRPSALKKLDQIVFDGLKFNESEKLLVEDLFNYTLLDFKGKDNSAGRHSTTRKTEFELKEYCEIFIKVIKAGFGQDKKIRATIFQENDKNHFPIRMIAIHLDTANSNEEINIDKCGDDVFWDRLNKLNESLMENESESGNIFYQRVVRIYSNENGIPTIYFIKPDQKRYWLRSQAVNDADEVAADIVSWFQNQIHSKGAKRKKIA